VDAHILQQIKENNEKLAATAERKKKRKKDESDNIKQVAGVGPGVSFFADVENAPEVPPAVQPTRMEASAVGASEPERRGSRRACNVIAMSGLDNATRKACAEAIESLKGGFKIFQEESGSPRITHLICSREEKRTEKMLLAIASGAWILPPKWVLQSKEQGKWLDEHKFERKGKASKAASLARADQATNSKRNTLLARYSLKLAGGTHSKTQTLKKLITALGGSVVTEFKDDDRPHCFALWCGDANPCVDDFEEESYFIKQEWLLKSAMEYQHGIGSDLGLYLIWNPRIERSPPFPSLW